MERPQATSNVHVDNERVRVTEWRFAPGEATGWHRHELDSGIVPVLAGESDVAFVEIELKGP